MARVPSRQPTGVCSLDRNLADGDFFSHYSYHIAGAKESRDRQTKSLKVVLLRMCKERLRGVGKWGLFSQGRNIRSGHSER